MLALAIFPDIPRLVGIQPLQVGGLLLALLILAANGLTWEFMTYSEDN